MLKLSANSRGETIIEVLITLAILAIVLGVSYATAAKSLKASQTAQERTEAQYVASSLLETVKVLAQRNSANVFPATEQNLCFSTSIPDITAQTPPVTYSPTNPQCLQGMYRKYIRITPLPLTPQGLEQYEYAATVEWDSLATGFNRSVMYYKFVRVPVTP